VLPGCDVYSIISDSFQGIFGIFLGGAKFLQYTEDGCEILHQLVNDFRKKKKHYHELPTGAGFRKIIHRISLFI
jgi:hypothetical protein